MEKSRLLEALNNHGVIAFPTETVMGLGVVFDDEKAIEKLNLIKGRPENKPYTLMLANKENIRDFAYLNDLSERFVDIFMPGPVTVLLKSKSVVPQWVDMGTGVIGIRIPDYKETLDVLSLVKKPLLVPSANKSGDTPALDSKDVKNIFGDAVDYIVEGRAGGQKPSTIIDLTTDVIKLVREGPIPFDYIIKKLGE